MHATCRSLVIAILTLLGGVLIGFVSMLTAAATFAATALIVPGTGTPNAENVSGFISNVLNYYLASTPCSAGSVCTLQGVAYPASLWPLVNTTADGAPGSFDKYGDSVAKGVAQLNAQLIETLTNTEGPVVVFGFSQGANVVSNELYNLAGLDQATKDRLTVVVAGNTQRPNGGIWTRLGLLGFIPILDIPLGMPTPNDIGIKTTDIAFEYDPVGDNPTYPIFPLTNLNALLGLFYIHVTYIAPNGKTSPTELPDGYTAEELAQQMDPTLHPENFRYFGDTTYITIPTKTLPIVRPLLDFGSATGTTPIVKPIVELVSPTLRVLIDLGYDRTINPGVYTPYKLIPMINPITLTVDLIEAAVQGIQDALNDIGTPAPPAPLAPSAPTTLAAVAPSATGVQAPQPLSVATSGVAGTTASPPMETQSSTTSGSRAQTTDTMSATATTGTAAASQTTGGPTASQTTTPGQETPSSGTTSAATPSQRPANRFAPGETAPVSSLNEATTTPSTTSTPSTTGTTTKGSKPGAKTPIGGSGEPSTTNVTTDGSATSASAGAAA